MSEDNKEEPIYGGLTPNKIEQLKRKHNTKNVFCITANRGAEELHFWFRKIDMTVLSAASKFITSDPLHAGQIIFDNTLILGEKSYKNDVDVFPAVCEQLMSTIETATATVKKF